MTIRRYPDRHTALYRSPDAFAPFARKPISADELGARFHRGI
jgi:hypothetical protein